MNLVRPLLLSSLVVALASAGCGHVPGVPGGGGNVNPDSCGLASASDVGAKLHAFLQATKDLQDTTAGFQVTLKASCNGMATELGIPEDNKSDAKAVCDKVFAKVQDNLKTGLKGGAHLKATITPGHCEVSASASASASAACSGGASAGTGGSSAGGECEAAAKVQASVHAECTPPQISVEADASLVVDAPKVTATVNALKKGLPSILEVGAKAVPVKDAVEVWAKSAAALGKSAKDTAKAFGSNALCVAGQLTAAAAATANIQANVSVSVSVSASASGSVGG